MMILCGLVAAGKAQRLTPASGFGGDCGYSHATGG
jgi:hypothetical protein